MVDNDRIKNGRFILTGSHQPSLHKGISQSLAGRVGQVVNLSSMSNEIGVSSTTLSEWLSVLEASFIVYRLKPYYTNITKQHIKSPKIYFSEVGLASFLLGIKTENQAGRDPLRGNLFENLIVSEFLKKQLNVNKDNNLYFLRTTKGMEIDLILKQEGNLYPYEIKTSMTPNKSFSSNLMSFIEGEEYAINPKIIYTGKSYPKFNGVEYLTYKNIWKYNN